MCVSTSGTYDDVETADGLLRYAYRPSDPDGGDNRKLRRAADLGLPLVLLQGIEHPLDDGDTLLLLDDTVCLELTGLADHWDEGGLRNLVEIIEASARRVLVAIARDRACLLPDDYQLWRELHQDLGGTQVDLLPVRALPAA